MSVEISLKYGLNPHQKQAKLVVEGAAEKAPLKVLNGRPGYINLLDAFGAWPLAKELKAATGKPGAASFKHVSPAGAAIARPLTEGVMRSQMIPAGEDLSPVALAYVRARGGDRMCSFGDFGAVSDVVDVPLAKVIRREVSDGIIAPGYEPEALEVLKKKKDGNYLVLEIDPGYEPPGTDFREVMGFKLYQDHNTAVPDPGNLGEIVSKKKDLPEDVAETLAVATIALKYAQSNSVCLAYDGQVTGMGAGQQSRVHCVRLAAAKSDKWFCQQHPRALSLKFKEGLSRVEKTNVVDQYLLWEELSDAEKDATRAMLDVEGGREPEPLTQAERIDWAKRFDGICVSSDAFFPFRDSIDRASRSNVRYVLQPGGAARDDDVTEAADGYGMVMIHSRVRWFLH
jgi:AICAR transformylase/IMP cyclohydrolase PurH